MMTIADIRACKGKRKITMLTAYDFPTASLLDQAGIDIILVGDSLAHVVLGLESTTQVGMQEMIHHAKAVTRAVRNAFVVGDMPFESYQVHPEECVQNARRFIEEAHCAAVKLEWFDRCIEVTEKIVASGIPVMGHIGLTPQTADRLGGFKVQGKDAEAAGRLIEQAKALEKAGCFSFVVECVPDRITQLITKHVSIPTIGIGAGIHCDGQVLVLHDLVGLCERFKPKFIKQYADLSRAIKQAAEQYKQDVIAGVFPQAEHSFTIKEEQFKKIKP